VAHESAGNQTAYKGYNLEYDAEGRINRVKIGATEVGKYVYDGDGRRVKKVWTSGTPATDYFVYNALGQLAVEYSTAAPPAVTGTTYPFTDMLGSVRAVMAQDGTVSECYDYLPFGRMFRVTCPL
jgi:YD repeat-containing protein